MSDTDRDLVEKYQSQIAQVLNEIKELEIEKRKLEWLAVSATSFEDCIKKMQSSSPESENVAQLKHQLKIFEMATGISVQDISISRGGEDGVVNYIVKGSSNGILFEVQFRDHFGDPADSSGNFRITNLEIDSMYIINTELGDFLDVCENQTSLGLFFSVFVPYTRSLADRQNVFTRLKKRFPDLVDSPDNDSSSSSSSTLTFHPVNADRVRNFTIEWKPSVSDTMVACSFVRLAVTADCSDDPLLSRASEMFDKMVTAMGPVRAVDSFVTSVCSAGYVKSEGDEIAAVSDVV